MTASEKPLPTRWESYEIVQATRVFSAPSEHAQLIANIEPGTQVNVVDSRNGWLEIQIQVRSPARLYTESSSDTDWTELGAIFSSQLSGYAIPQGNQPKRSS